MVVLLLLLVVVVVVVVVVAAVVVAVGNRRLFDADILSALVCVLARARVCTRACVRSVVGGCRGRSC